MIGVRRGIWPTVLCLAAWAVWPVLAAEGPKKPDGQPAAEKPAPDKAAEKPAQGKAVGGKPADTADPYVVPEGTPKELVQFIQKAASTRPPDAKAAERARQAIRKAAEKILAAKASEEEAEFAVQYKIAVLRDAKEIAAFGEELKKAGRANLARTVRRFTLGTELGTSAQQFEIESRLRQPSGRTREKVKKAVQDVVTFLQEAPPQLADARLAALAGQVARMTDDNDLTVATYRSVAKAFAASKDPQLAEFTTFMEGTARRLTLVGNNMKIEGKLLDGKPFDWSKYGGKVVLVDFWATWNGECLAEIPKLRKYYDFYHDKGFDIIGVSCDHRLADLEKYVKEKKIPWPIVFGGERPSPTVAYYGISPPAMILVGKDGKVVSLNARGPYLREGLEKLLGPMPSPNKGEAKRGADLRQPDEEEPNGSGMK